MIRSARTPRGRMPPEMIDRIRRARARSPDTPIKDLARSFGCSASTFKRALEIPADKAIDPMIRRDAERLLTSAGIMFELSQAEELARWMTSHADWTRRRALEIWGRIEKGETV